MAKSNILKLCEIIVFIIYVSGISVWHDSCRMTQMLTNLFPPSYFPPGWRYYSSKRLHSGNNRWTVPSQNETSTLYECLCRAASLLRPYTPIYQVRSCQYVHRKNIHATDIWREACHRSLQCHLHTTDHLDRHKQKPIATETEQVDLRKKVSWNAGALIDSWVYWLQ